LGSPAWKLKRGRAVLYYRFSPEDNPTQRMRVKIEINTREHFSHFELMEMQYGVKSTWFSGKAVIKTFCLEELLGTKLRALYQRKKGRDLFDLFIINNAIPSLQCDKVVECFQKYMAWEQKVISRAEFEANISEKLEDPVFTGDIFPILPEEYVHKYDPATSADVVRKKFISKLPGAPWKGKQKMA